MQHWTCCCFAQNPHLPVNGILEVLAMIRSVDVGKLKIEYKYKNFTKLVFRI